MNYNPYAPLKNGLEHLPRQQLDDLMKLIKVVADTTNDQGHWTLAKTWVNMLQEELDKRNNTYVFNDHIC